LAAEPPQHSRVLYNGIELPERWPPEVPTLSAEPMPLPYLASPPKLISIDVGRQLFVDDFVIESTTLKQTYHSAAYYETNPVLKPDKPWEMTGQNPTAMVFSDGVWYDPQDKLFKMWYMGGYTASTCYATSKDGLNWEKPALDAAKPGTNIVNAESRDSAAVWLDLEEKDPTRRYKLFRVGAGWICNIYFSADGIQWGKPVALCGPGGDRTTVFYNPFRKVWVYSIRSSSPLGRARRYREHADVLAGAQWKAGEPQWWVGADKLDAMRDDLKTRPELYNLDAVAYESLLLGLFSIWYGQPKDRPKPNEVLIGFSRDGFHWDRSNRKPFLPVSERQGDWNWGNVQSCGGGCLVMGDKLYFYVSGRAGAAGTFQSGRSSTGVAMLRRDGFASMDADEGGGTLTTRPMEFSGKFLFVNVDAPAGELRVEVLDKGGRVIEPFSATNCPVIRADSTCQPVRWKSGDDLTALAAQTVRFRFHVKRGKLYSFWVSADRSGASRGYVAAGGPGFTGPTDTVGAAPATKTQPR
jgi:hypothetical protein